MNQNNDQMRADIEERFLSTVGKILRATRSMTPSGPESYVVEQLVRSATTAYAVHGERGTLDFLQQLKDCCQNLWEARRWLLIAQRAEFTPAGSLSELIEETDILMRIYFSSIRTVEGKRDPSKRFDAGREDDVPYDGSWTSGNNANGRPEAKASSVPAVAAAATHRPRRSAAR